ncbi:hypothetical protein [Nostoc sp.]|uniref:hypothetical protein n=1 Tax=Nostoc sp. TaxID=1180 RepID=UPI002FFD2280
MTITDRCIKKIDKVKLSKQNGILLTQNELLLTHFGVFRKSNELLLIQKQLLLSHFGVFRKSNELLLTHFGVFRKQKKLLLSQTPVCFLISVFRAFMTNIALVAKTIVDLPEFSQANLYVSLLR